MPAKFREVGAFQIFLKELVQIEQSRMRLQVKRKKKGGDDYHIIKGYIIMFREIVSEPILLLAFLTF